MTVTDKTKNLLWGRASGRCQFDGCNKLLYLDTLTQGEENLGEVAHIIADSPSGPRGDEKLSIDDGYCDDISNLMLLCRKDHKLVDGNEKKFTAELLKEMKYKHEERIRRATDSFHNKSSNIVILRGRINESQPQINFQDTACAIFEEGYYPSNLSPIELSMSGLLLTDNADSYWDTQFSNLELQVKTRLFPLMEDPQTTNHYSIFAYAPIPLLIKFGSLFPNHNTAQVYQLKKCPQNWIWEESIPDFKFVISEPKNIHKLIAINLSLSADIDDSRIYSTLNTKEVSIWKVSITEGEYPKDDHLRSKNQLDLFKSEISKLLNRLKLRHGQGNVIHVFPATSVAYSVELGRLRNSKADLPWIIYDQNNKRNGFFRVTTIN